MSDRELSDEEAIEALYAYTAERMANGNSEHEIQRLLVEKGLDTETAGAIVANVAELRTEAIRDAAKKNMIYGALWCIGGIAVTAATYDAASGGGSYVVAWGAILFGGIQFVRGLAQSS